MRNANLPSLVRPHLFALFFPNAHRAVIFSYSLLFQSGSFSDLPMSIRCKTWPKVHHIVRTPLSSPEISGLLHHQSNIRDLLEAKLICFFFYAITSLLSSHIPRFHLQSITASLSYTHTLLPVATLTPFPQFVKTNRLPQCRLLTPTPRA